MKPFSVFKRFSLPSLIHTISACSIVMLCFIKSEALNHISGNVWYIDETFSYVEMPGDWSGTVYITASYATFNMKGHLLTGTGQPNGILIASGANCVSIIGNDYDQYDKGAIMNYTYGIVNYGGYTNISKIYMSSISENGIEERYSAYSSVNECDISAGRYGIAAIGSDGLQIQGSSVSYCGYDGIIMNSCQNTYIQNCGAYLNSRNGMYLIGSGSYVFSNYLTYNGSSGGHGVSASNCSSTNTLGDNFVYRNLGYGFYRSNSPYTDVDPYYPNTFIENSSGDKNW